MEFLPTIVVLCCLAVQLFPLYKICYQAIQICLLTNKLDAVMVYTTKTLQLYIIAMHLLK